MIANQERIFAEELTRLSPVLGKSTALRLSRAYLLGDDDSKKRMLELVDIVKAAVLSREELADSLLLEPPSKKIAAEGEITFGSVTYGKRNLYPIKLRKKDLLTHVGIFGSSGYGKTNVVYSLVNQLSQNDIPTLIFDFSKKNYRDMASTHLKSKIRIYTVGKNTSPIKFNPLKPPEGVPLSQWMKEFSSIFDHAYWLLGGGRHVILKSLDSVFKSNPNPKLSDLKDWLSKYASTNMPARERNWLATAERPLESLCFKELGEVFDCTEGVSPSEFFRPGQITILELDSLDNSDKSFFIEIVLQWIRDWLLASSSRESLKGVIVLEEAHHVLNREKSKKLGSETVMDLIFREIRELGMGIIYADQHPSLVSYPALGNTSTHIYMNLGLDTQHSSDVQDASSMLGLDYREQGSYLRKLPVGQAFMLCRASTFTNPFIVSFDHFPLKKGAFTDPMVSDLMNVQSQPKSKFTSYSQAQTQAQKAQDIQEAINTLQSNEWELIRILGSGQAVFASQIYKLVNVSGGIFKKRAQKLIAKGLVGTSSAKIRKNRMNYYYLTPLGESVYAKTFPNKPVKDEPMNLKSILYTLTEDKWICQLDEKENLLTLKRGDTNLRIHLKSTLNGQNSMNPGETFFLCSSAAVKNSILQHAARLSAEARKGFTIFISTAKEFAESGELEEVEFIV
jgi:DNA-binding MarR family transcriptional regulator